MTSLILLQFDIILFIKFKVLITLFFLILNKIWVYEICKSLHSVFIYILQSVPTFLELGLYSFTGVGSIRLCSCWEGDIACRVI